MLYSLSLALPLLIFPLGGLAAETVHGVVVFSRHGDRTSKFFPPTQLTALGQNQLYNSGAFYRSRYIDPNSNSVSHISGISAREAASSQLYAAAPDQNLLVNSGQAFLQGLYPPLSKLSQDPIETLTNGSIITPPLSGYQYATIHTIPDSDPSTIWLKGDDSCPMYTEASANFHVSELYTRLQASTKDFYESFSDILSGTLTRSEMGYTNAYPIFDYINVGMIHNDTIAKRVTPTELQQLRTLADSQEWALNGNISSVKAPGVLPVSGRTLANKILTQLASIIDSGGKKNKFSLLIGSYDTFLSFFALSQLPNSDTNFFGLPDYASTVAFEVISYSDKPTFPKDGKDLYIRFLFRNGTDDANPLREYPIFGHSRTDAVMQWVDFRNEMAAISVSSTLQWCGICNATKSFCPVSSGTSTTNAQEPQKTHKLSPIISGVVGATCALAFVGAVMVLVMIFFGVRFSRPRKETKEGGFKYGEKFESIHSQDRSSTDKDDVQPPAKVFGQ